jgi:hypothetical protein
MTEDSYGLGEYLLNSRVRIKKEQDNDTGRNARLEPKKENKPMVRCHTEYDSTPIVMQPAKSKNKSRSKQTSFSKKSFSKNKLLPKSKSPPPLRPALKLKK